MFREIEFYEDENGMIIYVIPEAYSFEDEPEINVKPRSHISRTKTFYSDY